MPNDLFQEIDIDINHFNEIFPNLSLGDASQYYNNDRFNDLFCMNDKRDLSVLHLNIRSMSRNGDCLITYLSLLDRKFDIICLSETFVNDVSIFENFLDGYKGFHSIRDGNQARGGVAIYVKNELNTTIVPSLTVNLDFIETVFIQIEKNNKKTSIGCCYRRPGSDKDLFLNYCNEKFSSINSNGGDIILCGDFNLCMLRASESPLLASFYDNMSSYSFIPTILQPSRYGDDTCSLIDNIFVNNLNNFKSGLLSADISDHLPIFIIYQNYYNSNNHDREIISYRRIDDSTMSHLRNAMETENLQIPNVYDIDERIEHLHGKILENFHISCPVKKKSISPKDKLKPWINDSIKRDMKQRAYYFKLYKLKRITKIFYNTFRNNVTKKIRFAKRDYFSKLFEELKNNIKKTWQTINSVLSRKPKNHMVNIKSLIINGSILTDDTEIAEALNKHFATVGKKIDESLPNNIPQHSDHRDPTRANPCSSSFFLAPITPGIVKTIIENMKNKSSHIDTYPIRIIKSLSDILSPIICNIINDSFENGYFPNFCKTAKVIPLFKSGEKTDVQNYRPISILPIFSKIIEKVVHHQLYGFLQRNRILSPNQYGFRKKLSTSDAIADMLQFLYDKLDKGHTVISFFLDFSKAFDTVNHNILLDKLKFYGIRGVPHNWFKSYLSNRSQFVATNNVLSSVENIHYGVPQGSTLGPLLFLLFINDFPNCSNFFKFTLFADDSTLTCSFKNFDPVSIQHVLEQELSKINDWLLSNRIKVNTQKSHFLIFSYRKKITLNPIKFGENFLSQCESTKFLGIYIDDHLTFKEHIEYILKKINKSVGILFKLNNFFPQHILVSLYNTLILPYFNYGIVSWHNSSQYALNRLVTCQKKAVRAICSLEYNAHTNDHFKELKILKLNDIYKLNLCAIMFSHIVDPLNYPISDRFVRNSHIHSYNTRNRDDFVTPRYSRTTSQSCFLYQSTVEWNSIPSVIQNCRNVKTFRKKFKTYILDRY